jgi:MoaA/NifB/PqqE/SkfB family radical SAM enzyme
VQQVEQLMGPDDIAYLYNMFMCGNWGDPAAAKYVFELYDHFRKHNPNITLGMNTNGSLRTPDWWRKLATILNQPNDYVIFSIDGLEDTNHIYRVNTVWEKIMENASAFIEAGGSAHWDMLVYRHNEHQVDQIQELAEKMGFKWFRVKVSKRPLKKNLEYPTSWRIPLLRKTGPIKCISESDQSVYIDARGQISPCCWQGYNNIPLSSFTDLKESWNTDQPNKVCAKTCSIGIDQTTTFVDQYQREVQFTKNYF